MPITSAVRSTTPHKTHDIQTNNLTHDLKTLSNYLDGYKNKNNHDSRKLVIDYFYTLYRTLILPGSLFSSTNDRLHTFFNNELIKTLNITQMLTLVDAFIENTNVFIKKEDIFIKQEDVPIENGDVFSETEYNDKFIIKSFETAVNLIVKSNITQIEQKLEIIQQIVVKCTAYLSSKDINAFNTISSAIIKLADYYKNNNKTENAIHLLELTSESGMDKNGYVQIKLLGLYCSNNFTENITKFGVTVENLKRNFEDATDKDYTKAIKILENFSKYDNYKNYSNLIKNLENILFDEDRFKMDIDSEAPQQKKRKRNSKDPESDGSKRSKVWPEYVEIGASSSFDRINPNDTDPHHNEKCDDLLNQANLLLSNPDVIFNPYDPTNLSSDLIFNPYDPTNLFAHPLPKVPKFISGSDSTKPESNSTKGGKKRKTSGSKPETKKEQGDEGDQGTLLSVQLLKKMKFSQAANYPSIIPSKIDTTSAGKDYSLKKVNLFINKLSDEKRINDLSEETRAHLNTIFTEDGYYLMLDDLWQIIGTRESKEDISKCIAVVADHLSSSRISFSEIDTTSAGKDYSLKKVNLFINKLSDEKRINDLSEETLAHLNTIFTDNGCYLMLDLWRIISTLESKEDISKCIAVVADNLSSLGFVMGKNVSPWSMTNLFQGLDVTSLIAALETLKQNKSELQKRFRFGVNLNDVLKIVDKKLIICPDDDLPETGASSSSGPMNTVSNHHHSEKQNVRNKKGRAVNKGDLSLIEKLLNKDLLLKEISIENILAAYPSHKEIKTFIMLLGKNRENKEIDSLSEPAVKHLRTIFIRSNVKGSGFFNSKSFRLIIRELSSKAAISKCIEDVGNNIHHLGVFIDRRNFIPQDVAAQILRGSGIQVALCLQALTAYADVFDQLHDLGFKDKNFAFLFSSSGTQLPKTLEVIKSNINIFKSLIKMKVKVSTIANLFHGLGGDSFGIMVEWLQNNEAKLQAIYNLSISVNKAIRIANNTKNYATNNYSSANKIATLTAFADNIEVFKSLIETYKPDELNRYMNYEAMISEDYKTYVKYLPRKANQESLPTILQKNP